MGISMALVLRTYPSVIHWTVGMSASKCSAMRGKAMLTPDWSITVRNKPMARAEYAHHL
jgi:hypothetical protein